MLGDMFESAEDGLEGSQPGLLTATQRLPRDCAFQLPTPQKARELYAPVGLKNQGATCYLNSLFQILFYTPEFRSTMLSLPLCKDTTQVKTDFLDKESKFNFVMGLQNLFAEMQLLDCQSVGTDGINKAFGWHGQEHVVQQDMHEAMRVIMDTFQRALHGTTFSESIKQNFRGEYTRYIRCLACGNSKQRVEPFFDMFVQTKHLNNLDASLKALIHPEQMEGSNKLFCESCNSKQDGLIGLELAALPNILIVTLGRFDFDYQKMDRVKLTNKLHFDLELDMNLYMTRKDEKSQDIQNYELYAVLIHSGSAHGGHYFAYVRDILKEANWEKTSQGAAPQDPSGTSKSEKTKEDQVGMKEPNNKVLLDNWYELNDSYVKPIRAAQISSQFGGSQSAYILFYRKVGLKAERPSVPEYLSKGINQRNQLLRQQREHYQNEQRHIILNINEEDVRLRKDTPLSTLRSFSSDSQVLVNVETVNNLPHYVQQIPDPSFVEKQGEQETIQSRDLVHKSIWKSFSLNDEKYLNEVLPNIGRERVPIHVNVLFSDKIHQMVAYSNQTLLELRISLEKELGVSYENQVIRLVSETRKQSCLTDDSANDQLTLSKLYVIQQSQLVLKELKSAKQNLEENTKQVGESKTLQSIAVERDDEPGLRRYYIVKTMTLYELVDYIRKTQGIDQHSKRRLRWLNGNRLFFEEQYKLTLNELNFQEEIIRMRLERGQIPIKGDICVKFRMQSRHQTPETPELVEYISDPTKTLAALKQEICTKYRLDPKNHKLYRTDWLGDPCRPVTKEHQTLFQASFGAQQKICLRDNESLIPQELLHFNVSITKSGFPEDCQKGFDIKIEQTKTLIELKTLILGIPEISTQCEGKGPLNIRVRELRRDYTFGNIFRGNNKALKQLQLPDSQHLVVQVLDHEEDLTDDDIVLVIKRRESLPRQYLDVQELIFKAGKAPKLDDLKGAILKHKQLELPLEQLRVMKYSMREFEWIELTASTYQEWMQAKLKEKEKAAKNKQKKENTKKEGKDNNDKSKQSQQNKDAALQKEEKPKQKKPKNKEAKAENTATAHAPKEASIEVKPKENAEQANKPTESKKGKEQQAKKGGKQKQAATSNETPNGLPDEENIRKVPFLIRDGDFIGYGFACEMLKDDDLQTQEDDNLRILKQRESGKIKKGRRNIEAAFSLNVQF